MLSATAARRTAAAAPAIQPPNVYSIIRAHLILDELRRHGVTDVLTLPDNASKALLDLIASDPGLRLLTVTREGEAFAIASGLWVGGRVPVVIIQNTGLLETGDALRGTAMRMRVPLACLVTYRGHATLGAAGVAPSADTMTGALLSRVPKTPPVVASAVATRRPRCRSRSTTTASSVSSSTP